MSKHMHGTRTAAAEQITGRSWFLGCTVATRRPAVETARGARCLSDIPSLGVTASPAYALSLASGKFFRSSFNVHGHVAPAAVHYDLFYKEHSSATTRMFQTVSSVSQHITMDVPMVVFQLHLVCNAMVGKGPGKAS